MRPGDMLSAASTHFRAALRSVRRMSACEILFAAAIFTAVMVGFTGQLLSLNFWVTAFPAEKYVLFSILVLTSAANAIVFGVIFAGWVIVKRPRLRFLLDPKGVLIVFGAGATVALNGLFIVSATAVAPEIFQALLLSTALPWTFLFVKVIFAETRSYFSPLVLLSFGFSVAGILLGSAQGFGNAKFGFDQWMWTLIFAVGVIPGAMNAVLSAQYMRRFTDVDEIARAKRPAGFDDEKPPTHVNHSSKPARETTALLVSAAGATSPEHAVTDANTAKLAMLTLTGVAQLVSIAVLIPTNAIPWFGKSDSVADAFRDTIVGVTCTFGSGEPICGDLNFKYMLVFNSAFLLTGAASAFLNFYSPALASIVGQLQAPLVSLVLLIAPSLIAPGNESPDIGYTIGAVLLLSAGVIAYTIWEEGTRSQQHDECGSPLLEENVAGVIIA